MGAGVGSGSMMSAAAGAVAAQQDPAMAKTVITLAAANNLITTTLGTYFTLFISLPIGRTGLQVPGAAPEPPAPCSRTGVSRRDRRRGSVRTIGSSRSAELGHRNECTCWGQSLHRSESRCHRTIGPSSHASFDQHPDDDCRRCRRPDNAGGAIARDSKTHSGGHLAGYRRMRPSSSH